MLFQSISFFACTLAYSILYRFLVKKKIMSCGGKKREAVIYVLLLPLSHLLIEESQ